MPEYVVGHADGTEEVRTGFDGQIWAEHEDGSRCPRTGKGRHLQRPLDPRCPGRARYVAKCRYCGWTGDATTHAALRATSRLHARFCDEQRPPVMTAQEWVSMRPEDRPPRV